MNLVTAADLMTGLEILKGKMKWVECPFCSGEVTKLRPCLYYQGLNRLLSYVCADCAESVRGLGYLAIKYPIPGVDITTELLPLYRKIDSKYINGRSYKAKVFLGEWSFTVWPRSTRLFVWDESKTPDFEKSYENTFQVWFAIKEAFEKGQSAKDLKPKQKKGQWYV